MALRTLNRARLGPCDVLAVLGLGVIGQCVLRAASAAGARVVGVDRSTRRREVAVAGAPNGAAELRTVLLDSGVRPDVVIDASGAHSLISDGVRALTPGGRLVVVSLPGTPLVLDLKRLTVLELEVAGSYAYGPEFAQAHRLVEDGAIQVADLVTGTYALEQVQAGFEAARDIERHLKVQFTP